MPPVGPVRKARVEDCHAGAQGGSRRYSRANEMVQRRSAGFRSPNSANWLAPSRRTETRANVDPQLRMFPWFHRSTQVRKSLGVAAVALSIGLLYPETERVQRSRDEEATDRPHRQPATPGTRGSGVRYTILQEPNWMPSLEDQSPDDSP